MSTGESKRGNCKQGTASAVLWLDHHSSNVRGKVLLKQHWVIFIWQFLWQNGLLPFLCFAVVTSKKFIRINRQNWIHRTSGYNRDPARLTLLLCSLIMISYSFLCQCPHYFNSLNAKVIILQKPVNWFALQINWLVFVWW